MMSHGRPSLTAVPRSQAVSAMYRVAIIVMSFFSSFAGAAEGDLPDALTAGWQGEKVCELLREDQSLRILRCTFPPGVGHERHFHPAHFGYDLKGGGRMRITDANGQRDLPQGAAGNSWQSSGVAWHQAINIGETTAQYLIIEKKY